MAALTASRSRVGEPGDTEGDAAAAAAVEGVAAAGDDGGDGDCIKQSVTDDAAS